MIVQSSRMAAATSRRTGEGPAPGVIAVSRPPHRISECELEAAGGDKIKVGSVGSW